MWLITCISNCSHIKHWMRVLILAITWLNPIWTTWMRQWIMDVINYPCPRFNNTTTVEKDSLIYVWFTVHPNHQCISLHTLLPCNHGDIDKPCVSVPVFLSQMFYTKLWRHTTSIFIVYLTVMCYDIHTLGDVSQTCHGLMIYHLSPNYSISPSAK